MKKLYKILPLILIFIILFSMVVNAEDALTTPIYACTVYDDWYMDLINIGIQQYYSDTGSSEEIFVYAVTLAVDSATLHRVSLFVGPRSSAPGNGASPTVMSAPGRVYNYNITQSSGNAVSVNFVSISDGVTLSSNANAKYQVIYVSQDIYDDLGQLYYQSPNPLYPEVEEKPKNDLEFTFDILEDFQDFTEQSSVYNDISQKQTITENTNNPNDGVFQNILQAISGLVHTGNSITQQISNQIQNFVEQFFNNFAQSALGLLTEINDSLGSLVEDILPDNLTIMIDQLYESGLDSEGNFGIDTMFDYWFIPDKEFMLSQFENLKDSVPLVSSVLTLGSDIYNDFINLEPESPTLVIPAGTYSVMTLENDYIFDFEWFIPFKKYTDPVVAAFLYIGAAWRLYTHLPGILAGVTGFVESPSFSANKSLKKGD